LLELFGPGIKDGPSVDSNRLELHFGWFQSVCDGECECECECEVR
jgi:hypothetical protein